MRINFDVRRCWRFFLVTVALFNVSLDGHALQLVDVVDGQTATIKVSSGDLTRIAMADGGRINRIWGLDDYMQVEPDREGGQVFLRPAPGMMARAFSFFVRDDQGDTYTLLAVPVDMPSETVLLRSKNRMAGVLPTAPNSLATPYTEKIQRLVRAIARGAVPEGYLPTAEEREISLWAETRLVLIARYNGDLLGEVYQLTNITDEAIRLDEREFAPLANDIKAVAILEHTLAPKQMTHIYLIREGR